MGNSAGSKQGKRKSRNENSILQCGDRLCSLTTITRRCYDRQVNVALRLTQLADELDEVKRDMNKAKVGLSAVGAAVAVTGFGLSFFTFGSSLVLTVMGATVSAASAAGAIATTLAEKAIKNKTVKAANEAVLSYTEAITEFAPVLEYFCAGLSSDEERQRMRDVLTDASTPSDTVRFIGIGSDPDLCETCAKGHKIVATALRVQEALGMQGLNKRRTGAGVDVTRWTLGMLTDASSFGAEAFKTFNSAAKVIKIGGAALVGVGLIIDVGSIIYYSIKVHKKKPSEVAHLFRILADAFQQ
ncbi:apolipoprotein L3-like [Haliotis asinina]|uniref:apolipoprotein L3-like n=1 Tax=Haliotis asinina TaxID=109174 RepID=UPI003531D54B